MVDSTIGGAVTAWLLLTPALLSSSSDGSGQRPRLLGDKNIPPAIEQWAPKKEKFFNGCMDIERLAAMAANCR